MTMWEAYQRADEEANAAWRDGDRPAEITAVAAATGLDPDELWDVVEGQRGWEPHNAGYQAMVWFIAWGLKGYPDWTEAAGGDQPLAGA